MDKKTKIGFFIIALILILSQFLTPKKDEVNIPKKSNTETKVIGTNKSSENQQIVLKPNQIASIGSQSVQNADTVTFSPIAYKEKDIIVDTDLFKAVFSSKGGTLKHWILKKYYKKGLNNEEEIDLVRPNTENLVTEIMLNNGNKLTNYIYDTDVDNISLNRNNIQGEISFYCKDDKGNLLYTKKYIFNNNLYSFDILIDRTPLGNMALNQKIVIDFKGGMPFTEISAKDTTNVNREDYYLTTYAKKVNEDRVEFDKNDDQVITSGNIEWGATRIKYFEAFIASYKTMTNPTDENIVQNNAYVKGKYADFENSEFTSFSNYPSKIKGKMFHSDLGFSLEMKPQTLKNRFMVLFGPLDNEIMKSYNLDFDTTLNWGWSIIKPFSKAILWVMMLLHKFIPNYGWVIVILSLLVNTLLIPVTFKSFKSQMGMKRIQPHIKEIKKRHKGDMQKQQQETMKLYKEHNVSPFGSCLPMLLPMPILYGMFMVFGATIEFRGAGFIGWITDLSLPEVMFALPFKIPFYGQNVGLLPIIMAVFMLLQMKDSNANTPKPDKDDPMAMNQKMMTYLMPVMMLVFFNNFSSGLILYYAIGNIFRYVQQKLINMKFKTT